MTSLFALPGGDERRARLAATSNTAADFLALVEVEREAHARHRPRLNARELYAEVDWHRIPYSPTDVVLRVRLWNRMEGLLRPKLLTVPIGPLSAYYNKRWRAEALGTEPEDDQLGHFVTLARAAESKHQALSLLASRIIGDDAAAAAEPWSLLSGVALPVLYRLAFIEKHLQTRKIARQESTRRQNLQAFCERSAERVPDPWVRGRLPAIIEAYGRGEREDAVLTDDEDLRHWFSAQVAWVPRQDAPTAEDDEEEKEQSRSSQGDDDPEFDARADSSVHIMKKQ